MTAQAFVEQVGSVLWRLENGACDVAEAAEQITEYVGSFCTRDVRLRQLALETAQIHSVGLDAILGRGRTAAISEARQSFVVDARDEGYSFKEIGAYLGRHHTTVMHLDCKGRG